MITFEFSFYAHFLGSCSSLSCKRGSSEVNIRWRFLRRALNPKFHVVIVKSNGLSRELLLEHSGCHIFLDASFCFLNIIQTAAKILLRIYILRNTPSLTYSGILSIEPSTSTSTMSSIPLSSRIKSQPQKWLQRPWRFMVRH